MNSMQLNLLLDAIRCGRAEPATEYARRECDRLIEKGFLNSLREATDRGRAAYESLA